MDYANELSVIIPFFNEKEEVENTLKSLRENGGENISVILVNDASDDQYDYRVVSDKYNAIYVENNIRIGSGPSKQIGIEICKTDFFLVIDSHMRFYQNNWIENLIQSIKSDERAIYCFRCKPWDYSTKQELNIDAHYGAYLKYVDHDKNIILQPLWIKQDIFSNQTLVDIPCVLGACYAASKKYWMYLKGYCCLKHYGSEEAFISLKAWLEGGRCRLIKNVIIGHLFRDVFPYSIDMKKIIYNKIIVSKLLLPEELSNQIHSALKKSNYEDYANAKRTYSENLNEIQIIDRYLKCILTYDYERFERINSLFSEDN